MTGCGEADGWSLPDHLYNIDVEVAILGSLMRANDQVDRVADILKPEDFGNPVLGDIYRVIVREVSAGRPAIPPTIVPMFAQDQAFKAINGGPTLAFATASTDSSLPAIGLTRELRDLAQRRRLIEGLREAGACTADLNLSLSEATGAADTALSSITSTTSRPALSWSQAFDATLEYVRKVRDGEIEPGLHVHGFQDWNDITGGIMPGQYILLGGRPSMGKTALALSILRRAARAGYGVLFISREMDTEQLMLRVIADLLFEARGFATFEDVKKGRLSETDIAILARVREQTKHWPIVVENPDALSSGRIAPMIRRHQRQMEAKGQKLGLVILDYLGLIDPPPSRQNREQEVSAISKDIKTAAGSTQVPIIALTQLSRAVEQREDKHPQLSDLRDSGTLEQDADVIVFVYRHQYYLERSEPEKTDKKYDAWLIDWQSSRDRVEIYSAKNRQGEAPVRRTSYFFGNRQAIRNSGFYSGGPS